jgi:hypothetical protein
MDPTTTATTLENLLARISSAPTGPDLYRICSSTNYQQNYSGLSEADKDVVKSHYHSAMQTLGEIYKLQDLESIPLRVNDYAILHNGDDGSSYIELKGFRKDTGESFKVRTRAEAVVNHFHNIELELLPVDVILVRFDRRRSATYRPTALWMVHPIVPLTALTPFATRNAE